VETTAVADTTTAVAAEPLQPQKKAKGKAALKDLDFLAATAYKVENLTQDQALAALSAAIETGGGNDYWIGGVLAKLQAEQWFNGHESFKKMVEDQYGMAYGKATYLAQNYRHLTEQQIPWVKLEGLGWTKVRTLCENGFLTAENADAWTEKAKHLTVNQLRDAIKALSIATPVGDADAAAPTSEVTNMTFKLHTDQKATVQAALDKAKAELHTEFDTVALDGIATQYLSGGAITAPVKVSLIELMQKHTVEEVLAAFEAVFPHIDLYVKEAGDDNAAGDPDSTE